ncbi:MAG: hemerythrin HHE cation-binding protein [Chroococcales cyanobacterium]
MVNTLNRNKQSSLTEKLANLEALQRLLITNEQKLIVDCREDQEIEERIDNILQQDKRNLKIIQEVIQAFSDSPEPQPRMKQFIDQVEEMMAERQISLYEKVAKHERLKHQQVMIGLLLHKAAQVLGKDIENAIAPLNQVNFDNRAHQEQLKGISLILGTREITGKDLDRSIWGQADDAIAAMKGVFGSFTH